MPTLPTPGADADTWGDELNTYLLYQHNADGTHKQTGLFNVRDTTFGAVGDGVADDTAAIQAAITAASPGSVRGTVLLPSGFYRVTSPLLINASYVTLRGAGRLASQILLGSGGADLAAVLRIGSTGSVQEVNVRDLAIEGGGDKGHTTGAGITIDGQVTLRDVYVGHAPQDGIVLSTAGQVFQTCIEDVYINVPGRDGLVIGTNHFDCDYVRVYVKGGSSSAAKGGRYGIYNKGAEQHFLGCHPFFMGTDGLRSDAGSVQVIGGEYETNGATGVNLITQSGDCLISDVTGFYGNVSTDISTSNISAPNRVIIRGNSFRSAGQARNVSIASDQCIIQGNSFRFGTSEALLLNTASHCTVQGNVFDTVGGATRSMIILNGSRNTVIGNVVAPTNPKNMIESGTSNFNVFLGNQLNGATITILGANSSQVNNV